jgi:2-phosphosulfolactate phosphatase
VKLDVAFTPGELAGGAAGERTVVVIDVLRATSTILEALVNGAHAVVPVASVEAAVTKAQEIGRDQVILCGERGGEPIPGFQLGNSPLEFTTERVAGRTLVMTTTNGTRALLIGATAARCFVGCFLNALAVARAVCDAGGDVLLLCAGREGRFALEDALCAGMIARGIAASSDGRPTPNDAARTAAWLARRRGAAIERSIARTAAGKHLQRLGRTDEVKYCAQVDRHPRVPAVRDRRVTLLPA